MNTQDRIALALELLDRHEKLYKQKVPQRLRDFWKNGEFAKYENCFTKYLKIPQGSGSFQILTAVPSWEIQGQLGGLDSSIVDPNGDWEHAKKFIPLFHAEQDFFFVVRLDKADCPVGWYEEETWEEDGDGFAGYKMGVYKIAKSLDEFLSLIRDSADGEAIEIDFPKEIERSWDETRGVLKSNDERDPSSDDDDSLEDSDDEDEDE
ncbi:SMI1/KNR4 family protein [Leptospira barantonii]|nr:SMI1/KNR4 family protein [Leptospira barantonii]